MKTIKITCDRCGVEISGDPYRVFIEQVERESEDIISDSINIIRNDFCEACAHDIALGLTERPVNLMDTFEPEIEPGTEPEAEEPVSDLSETCQEPERPEPKKRGGSVKGVKRFTDERKETIMQMARNGTGDEEIAKYLDMPVEKISKYISQNGFRTMISDKPKQEPKPERVTASGVTFGL